MTVISSTSGTGKYRLKNSKAKTQTPIIFDFSYGRGNRFKASTGLKILPKYWDSKNQKVRAISTLENREGINSKLKSIDAQFNNKIAELSPEEKQSIESLKQVFSEIINPEKVKQVKKVSFFTYAEDFLVLQVNHQNSTSVSSLSMITIRAYKQTIKQLKQFSEETNFKLDFNTIDVEFYFSFVSFLEEKEFSLNTIGKHIKNIIALLNRATEDGVNTNLKYKHRDFKRLSERSHSIYLNQSEMDKIYNLDLSKNPTWEHARDIFIIGYYTGQRVSDYNGLTTDQISIYEGTKVFEIYQKKTKKTVYIPVHPKVLQLMNLRYNGGLPNKMPDNKINEYLKHIGRKAKINEMISTSITKGGSITSSNLPKHKLIGTHTARRSFCTNAYLSKMPVIDIMALSGHTTEREFYNYIKVTPKERAVKISTSSFFN